MLKGEGGFIKVLFKEHSWLGLRTAIWVALSLLLMFFNQHYPYFTSLRSYIDLLVLPVQQSVDKPVQFANWFNESLSSQQQLLEENASLRASQLLANAKLQRMAALEQENRQLRQLLAASTKLNTKFLTAQLLAVTLDPYRQEILVDEGQNAGVSVGQPVLDAYGIMGQVVGTTAVTSRVMLITDTRSAIPVQDNRSNVRAIAAGLGASNQLTLLHVPVTADVAVGDLLVTSGLGQKFPFGYPLGTVKSVQKNTGSGFADIVVTPIAHIERTRVVVLVWPSPEQLQVNDKADTQTPADATNANLNPTQTQ